jgi:hypothetical protein
VAVPVRQADEPDERHPGRDPERRVEAVRDRLDAVGARRERRRPQRRHDLREQGPPEAQRLDLRQHEQHREEPQVLAPVRGGEGDDGRRSAVDGLLGHDEPVGVGRMEVVVEPQDRGEVVGMSGWFRRRV